MKSSGFTLVELAVAIAVIGILSTIVAVSYRGTEHRAGVAAIEADAKQAIQQAARFKYDNGTYPQNEGNIHDLGIKVTKDVYYDSDNFAICSGNSSFGIVGRAKNGTYYAQTSNTKFREHSGPTNISATSGLCQSILNESSEVYFGGWAKNGTGASSWTSLVQ